MRIHLIDGTFELFRAYFGAPRATGADQITEVGAARGLLRSLAALVADPDVTHIAAAFDSEVESFRNQLFDGYKTGEGLEPELFAQFPLAERAAHALGITVWPMREFEADDALATAAARFAADEAVDQIIICSPDKDLCQCVQGDRVITFDRIRKQQRNEQGVLQKFGVSPASIPDWLALVGDTADGIPGIPRWGAKSAATVLARYRHVDEIPDAASDWDLKVRGAEALATNLRERRSEAALYRRLAVLRTDVPLEESMDDLAWRGARRQALTDLCTELGERSVPSRLASWRDD